MNAIDKIEKIFKALDALDETPTQTIERINLFKVKAQKYDDIMAASNEVVKNNLQLAEAQMKITRLEHHLYDKPHYCNCEKI